MAEQGASVSTSGQGERVAQIQTHLHDLDRRQWSLWSAAVAVMILLTIGVASFAFPGILAQEESNYSFFLNVAIRGLVGLVLLFSVYLVYQQVLINRLRMDLSNQIQSLAKVESLATEVYRLAALDQLTGLYNRRSGEQRLDQEMGRALRHGRPLTILLLDMDSLKQVNDTFGHAAGDTMLKAFSDRVQKAIRGSDVAVRLGGDEFLVVLPECRADEVKHVLGRIDGLTVDVGVKKIPCSFSSGWTDFKPGETAQELLKRGDDLLYENKRSGKNSRIAPAETAVTQPAP
jgi:diguanylate cyclase (GGDEF)-like protein